MSADNYELIYLYEQIITEGLEDKIPKLINLVANNIENKEEYIRWAAETFDPTKNSEYITWILRMLKKGIINGEEDSDKVKERLLTFTELKRKPQFPKDKRDINVYKTYGDLAETLDEYQGIKTKGEVKRESLEEGIEFIDSSSGEEGKGTNLYIVTTEEAAAKHFRQTDWCVKDPRFFNNYGPPYYFFTEDGEPKTLLHLNSNQCMDVRDRPTDLDREEKELMESEKMTNYVMENDNSDAALSFYTEKVGGGYDDAISNIFWGKIDSLMKEANSELEMFTIDEPYTYGEEFEYYEPSAYGYIKYDMSPYDEYKNDRDFLNVLADVLNKFDIYPEEFAYSEPILDDLEGIRFGIKYENSYYTRDSIVDKLESFIRELESIERRFDIESFGEHLQEVMIDKGYLSSDWGNFKNRVSLDDIQFKNFGRVGSTDIFKTERVDVGSFVRSARDYTINSDLTKKYRRDQHPYVLVSEFLKPFISRGLEVKIEEGAMMVSFSYEPMYEADKTGREYVRGLKAIRDFDTHFEFYVNQIRNFFEKYVTPYLENKTDGSDEYNIPPDIKIPLIQIKSRKESGGQMTLDLHEKRIQNYVDCLKLKIW
jgi:hypothetical protein